jgi:hypothetical protein
MADETKHIFISHIHEDDAGIKKLKDICKNNGLDVKDGSINSTNPNNAKDKDYIKTQILAPQINWASTLVVYITPDTKDSDWVKWEIEYAEKMGKRIVGVWAYGENDCEVPDALKDHADAIVGWHGESIVDAITGKNNDWYSCQGTKKEPQNIKRYSC